MQQLIGFSLSDDSFFTQPLGAFIIFLCFIASVVICLVCKKLYMRLRYTKRYYIFPRINVKGIANVAMAISIAIATLLLLTVLSAGVLGVLFRAYPGWRVNIEAILIKIGGLLFGPIIGMVIGAVTDLLSIVLTAGMFHYGYFIACILYGLLAGLIKVLMNATKGKQLIFAFFSSILILLGGIAIIIYVLSFQELHFEFASKTIDVPSWQLSLFVVAVFGISLLILWIYIFVRYRPLMSYQWANFIYNIKYRLKLKSFTKNLSKENNVQEVADQHLMWQTTFGEKCNNMRLEVERKFKAAPKYNDFYLLPVMIAILFSETIVSIFILPSIDTTFSGTFELWFTTRVMFCPILIVVNIAIIYPIYRVVCPIINYDYSKDSLENVRIPFMVE